MKLKIEPIITVGLGTAMKDPTIEGIENVKDYGKF